MLLLSVENEGRIKPTVWRWFCSVVIIHGKQIIGEIPKEFAAQLILACIFKSMKEVRYMQVLQTGFRNRWGYGLQITLLASTTDIEKRLKEIKNINCRKKKKEILQQQRIWTYHERL